ncbi:MAG: PorP/SprF family type IX secretion system membrane protein [Fulvivirga sp.]
MLTRFFCCLFILASYSTLLGQDNSSFTHYFMNPYLINPSYAGTDGRASLAVTYRKQWVDIEGAPTIGNFSFHTPTGKNVGFGLNVTNAERSILNTTSGYITTSYGLWFSDKVGLRFGFSGGVAYNGIDYDEIENISDPVFSGILDQNLYLIGNAGLSIQIHHFNLGVAIPNLFTDEFTSSKDFTQGEIEPMENIVLTASNRFYLDKGGKFIFEPFFVYRYSDFLPHQIEGTAVLHINNLVWLGGSYKQDFGISGFGGIKINKLFGLGYAYSLKNSGANEINSPTHEIHLNLLLGIRNKKRLVYSFVDTSIPKTKSKKDIAKEQRLAEAAEKKKQEAEVKRAEQERVEKEKIAKEQKKAEEQRVLEERQREEQLQREQEEANEAQVEEPVINEEPENAQVVEQQKPQGNINGQVSTEERVIVKKGNHLLELSEGEYVVVGVFSDYEHAEKFSDELFFKGYQSKFGYITQQGYWYVYVHESGSISEARTKRDEFRKSAFPKAWVLTVQ